jgi:metal-sulfur cluster biosynthetic enzyme
MPDDVPHATSRNMPSMNVPDDAAVLEALREVDDPEAGMNIVDLGLVYGVEVAGGAIHVDLTMTTQACPMTDMIVDEVRQAIGNIAPVWSSSAAGVATVNASGIVTGVSAGSAIITATSGSASNTANITVTGGAGVLATVVASIEDRTIEIALASSSRKAPSRRNLRH